MAPQAINYGAASDSSGLNTPVSELESLLPVHPTAVRRPYPIAVQSEQTAYTDDHITAKFFSRSSDVVLDNGLFKVTPTVKPYEFQTQRKVAKTGSVNLYACEV